MDDVIAVLKKSGTYDSRAHNLSYEAEPLFDSITAFSKCHYQ
jgi:hypothetical protein